MENTCPRCRRTFHGDLAFCPYCRTEARPPKTRHWHYEAPGTIAHTDPVRDGEVRVYRQNGWTLLCCGILGIPAWLFLALELTDELRYGPVEGETLVFFLLGTALVVLVFMAAALAFQARRPGVQVMAALLVVIGSSLWHPFAIFVMMALFLLALGLWAMGGDRYSHPDPSYLTVLTGIAILGEVMAYLFMFNTRMSDLL